MTSLFVPTSSLIIYFLFMSCGLKLKWPSACLLCLASCASLVHWLAFEWFPRGGTQADELSGPSTPAPPSEASALVQCLTLILHRGLSTPVNAKVVGWQWGEQESCLYFGRGFMCVYCKPAYRNKPCIARLLLSYFWWILCGAAFLCLHWAAKIPMFPTCKTSSL